MTCAVHAVDDFLTLLLDTPPIQAVRYSRSSVQFANPLIPNVRDSIKIRLSEIRRTPTHGTVRRVYRYNPTRKRWSNRHLRSRIRRRTIRRYGSTTRPIDRPIIRTSSRKSRISRRILCRRYDGLERIRRLHNQFKRTRCYMILYPAFSLGRYTICRDGQRPL